MKQNTLKKVGVITATLAFGLTACKKESITQKKGDKSFSETALTAKAPRYGEGIMSNNGYSGGNSVNIGYYQFWGPSPGQHPNDMYTFSDDTGSGEVIGCGAAAKRYVFAFKTSTGAQWLEGTNIYTLILNVSGNVFKPQIEEIEIHPQTHLVYALVTEGSSKRIYVIDPSSGIATPVSCNGAYTIFHNPIGNGYKCGSITFVPDGSGSYEFVFSNESDVYAHLGVVSWHFSISGNNLASIVANHRTYKGIPGTAGSGINTTYGNGKLYFTRESSTNSNHLYSLNLTSNDTYTDEGFTIANKNDFGYWKAF